MKHEAPSMAMYRIIWEYDGVKSWVDYQAHSAHDARCQHYRKYGAADNYFVLDVYKLPVQPSVFEDEE